MLSEGLLFFNFSGVILSFSILRVLELSHEESSDILTGEAWIISISVNDVTGVCGLLGSLSPNLIFNFSIVLGVEEFCSYTCVQLFIELPLSHMPNHICA